MTRCRSKLVLALGTARLARTCVRPLPARPVERPDLHDYAPLSHMVNHPSGRGSRGLRSLLDLPSPLRRRHLPPGLKEVLQW